MNWLLIYIFSAVCLWLIGAGLTRSGKIYEYPFLAGTTFLGFVLPQMPALANDPFLPEGAFAKTASFTILCAAACGLGWTTGNRPMRILRWTLDGRRLLWVAALLSVAGAFFYFKLSRLPKEVLSSSQWTGLPVQYIFFAKLLNYGFLVAVLCFMRRPSKTPLCIALFGAMLILDRVIIAGRRSEMTEVLLAILLAAWFHRGIAAPRIVALAGALAAALALGSTGDYREISQGDADNKWSQLSKIDVLGNFRELLQNGGPELRNATLRINATDRSLIFDYGIFHWNVLVFNFVPAQIVGRAFKESLRLEIPGEYDRDYVPSTGSTETGMADAFASFWYFGAIKFLLIGYSLGRIYRAAMAGSAVAQLLYMLSVAPAMVAITHHTQWVLSSWVNIALLLLPALALSRTRMRTAGIEAASARTAIATVGAF
jgi:oligosaccharide repeat unit polymerase